MAFCGECTLYVTPPAPLRLAPYTNISAAAIMTTPAVSVVVSTYLLRICYIAAKLYSPLDVPLAAIESLQQHRGSDGAWVAVKCKTTCALRLIVYNTMGDTEEGVNILASLMRAIEAAIQKSMSDFFAFSYFASLKKICVANAHELGLKVSSYSNTKVPEGCNGISLVGYGVNKDNSLPVSSNDPVRNAPSYNNKENNESKGFDISITTTADADADAPCVAKEGEDVIFSMVKEIPVLSTVRSLNDMNEASLNTLLGERGGLQMRPSVSAGICESTVPIARQTRHIEKEEREEVSYINTQTLELPSPLKTKNEFNTPQFRYSIIDDDFYRMTRLTCFSSEELKSDDYNKNVMNSIPPVGLGTDISPWFHIIPLFRGNLFGTYPFSIVAPRRVTVEIAERVSLYRHNGRILSISWIHPETGASISRAAQPGSGGYISSDADALFCSFLNPSFQCLQQKNTIQKEFNSMETEDV
ncbi:Myotubularin-like phosphatase domain [Trypanosoma melophagium]|uniref:Myotubularin-like phosphatase domain n=1 Tax=Trypanosoma melophagium TaxID=715481 RepID=UPI00351A8C35|nr:Myotubularin-like phosphatase domain [Trypanosoma melophagium]